MVQPVSMDIVVLFLPPWHVLDPVGSHATARVCACGRRGRTPTGQQRRAQRSARSAAQCQSPVCQPPHPCDSPSASNSSECEKLAEAVEARQIGTYPFPTSVASSLIAPPLHRPSPAAVLSSWRRSMYLLCTMRSGVRRLSAWADKAVAQRYYSHAARRGAAVLMEQPGNVVVSETTSQPRVPVVRDAAIAAAAGANHDRSSRTLPPR